MTDRAINFSAIVERLRDAGSDGQAAEVVTVDGTGPIDVCEALFDRLEEPERGPSREFFLSPNTRRELERRLVATREPDDPPAFLDKQLRTDVSMPDDAVLYLSPAAVTLGGRPTGASPVGVGRLSSADDAEP